MSIRVLADPRAAAPSASSLSCRLAGVLSPAAATCPFHSPHSFSWDAGALAAGYQSTLPCQGSQGAQTSFSPSLIFGSGEAAAELQLGFLALAAKGEHRELRWLHRDHLREHERLAANRTGQTPQMVLKLLERGEEGGNKLEAREWLATRWSEWSGGDLSSASGRFGAGLSLWDQVLVPGPHFEEQS